jgi:MYXO-CTERM domain-containing protein
MKRQSKVQFNDWRVYAAAAGATLAMTSSADASIVHTTVDKTITISTTGSSQKSATFQLPVHGGLAPETMALRHVTSGANSGYARINGVIQFATTGGKTSGGGRAAKIFAPGMLIGPLTPVTGGGATFLVKHTASGAIKGGFAGVQTGYLGFNTGFGDYGWLKVMVSDAGSQGFANEIEVLDYAYNNATGDAPRTILAGDTGASPTPEPNTSALALLSLGAAGIVAWRRRRNEVTSV